MEDITDTNYSHIKRVCKYFEIKKVTRILWFIYSKQCIIVNRWIWELSKYVYIWTWPCSYFYCTRISIARSLKMTKVKLDVLTDIDMLLMVGKGIHWYGRANN